MGARSNVYEALDGLITRAIKSGKNPLYQQELIAEADRIARETARPDLCGCDFCGRLAHEVGELTPIPPDMAICNDCIVSTPKASEKRTAVPPVGGFGSGASYKFPAPTNLGVFSLRTRGAASLGLRAGLFSSVVRARVHAAIFFGRCDNDGQHLLSVIFSGARSGA